MDDDPGIRGRLSTLVRITGFNVEQATDGFDCLERLTTTPKIDLVLLDLMMPKVNGWEVIHALKEVPDRPSIIVMTAASEYDTHNLDGRVVSAIIRKPFDVADVQRIVRDTAGALFAERQV